MELSVGHGADVVVDILDEAEGLGILVDQGEGVVFRHGGQELLIFIFCDVRSEPEPKFG